MNDYDKRYHSDPLYRAESDKRRVNKEIRQLEQSILSSCKSLSSKGQRLDELEMKRRHIEIKLENLKREIK